MRILLIEDEEIFGAKLVKRLKQDGFIVDWADRGDEGNYLLEVETFDCAILDIQLPGMSGLEILENIRCKGISTPIIMLTTLNLVKDRVRGFEHGADDYLGKPFEYEELLVRIKSLIRRSQSSASSQLIEDDLTMDLNRREVHRGGIKIDLSSREYNLLEALLINKGKVLNREQLFQKIYDINAECDGNVLDVYISYLRRKIDRPFSNNLIHTVRGVGYILESKA